MHISLAAPTVRVEAEEIRRRLIIVVGALHVGPCILRNLAHISSGVTNRDGAINVVLDVVLQVALDSPDVHGVVLGRGKIIHDFVGSKEGKGVGEGLEVLDDTEDARKVVLVVRSPWFGAVDALARERRVDIKDQVDTGGIEDGHALGVVESGINVVDTDSVHLHPLEVGHLIMHGTYTQLLHDHSIAETHVCVCEGILFRRRLVSGLTSRLVVNAHNHQPLVRDGIDKVLAADLNRVDGMGNAREQRGDERERANELSDR